MFESSSMFESAKVLKNTLRRCPACESPAEPYAYKNGYATFRCTSCRTLFVHPYPSAAETSSIYSEDYFCGGGSFGGYTDYEEDKKAMEGTFRAILRRLERQNPNRGRLLDVGAATGYFVALAREAGWDAIGIEISSYAVQTAKKKSRPVEEGTLLSFHSSEKFDAMTLWDVFEHLTNPEEHLRAIRRILKPGGSLMLITPRADALWARCLGARWHLLIPPEHVICYSADGIRKILREQGFEVNSIESVAKRFTVQYVLHIAKNWLGWQWIAWLEKFAQRVPRSLALPLNFHDNMFVLATNLDR
jgi:2-polyprenyl-3-methyl-5-hydroxy-6-metoxy-1,4-benzoquinol methylase